MILRQGLALALPAARDRWRADCLALDGRVLCGVSPTDPLTFFGHLVLTPWRFRLVIFRRCWRSRSTLVALRMIDLSLAPDPAVAACLQFPAGLALLLLAVGFAAPSALRATKVNRMIALRNHEHRPASINALAIEKGGTMTLNPGKLESGNLTDGL